MFKKIGFGTPLNETVLLYWDKTGHVEDGYLYYDLDGEHLFHCLFDGEALNDQPTHWMPMPEVDRNDA